MLSDVHCAVLVMFRWKAQMVLQVIPVKNIRLILGIQKAGALYQTLSYCFHVFSLLL